MLNLDIAVASIKTTFDLQQAARAVNSYDPCKGYLKEYILSQLKREMVRIRSTQTVYGLTQAPANIGSTIVPLTIAAQRESYWETYIAV